MKQNIFLFGAQNKKPEFEIYIKDLKHFGITGRYINKNKKIHYSKLEKILKGE